MTYVKDVFGNDLFKDFNKFYIGFDNQFNKLAKIHDDIASKNIPNYPPYNIRKVDNDNYILELAVAGFSKQDIDITVEEDNLIIKGNSTEVDSGNFVFKGIANRSFTRSFALGDLKIQNASLVNGMLEVTLERIIPEHKKPRKIEILDNLSVLNPQLLTESIPLSA